MFKIIVPLLFFTFCFFAQAQEDHTKPFSTAKLISKQPFKGQVNYQGEANELKGYSFKVAADNSGRWTELKARLIKNDRLELSHPDLVFSGQNIMVYQDRRFITTLVFSAKEDDLEFLPSLDYKTKPLPKVALIPALKVGSMAVPEVGSTPVLKVGSTLVPEVGSTPAPEVGSTPAPKVESTPAPKVASTPVPEIASTPVPKVGSTVKLEITKPKQQPQAIAQKEQGLAFATAQADCEIAIGAEETLWRASSKLARKEKTNVYSAMLSLYYANLDKFKNRNINLLSSPTLACPSQAAWQQFAKLKYAQSVYAKLTSGIAFDKAI